MRYAFVQFIEDHGKEHGGRMECTAMVSGDGAESPEAFINWHNAGCKVEVVSWFQVPECWENSVAGDAEEPLNDAIDALLGLEALAGKPVISDLLATIFGVGFKCGQKREWDIQLAFSAGQASAK